MLEDDWFPQSDSLQRRPSNSTSHTTNLEEEGSGKHSKLVTRKKRGTQYASEDLSDESDKAERSMREDTARKRGRSSTLVNQPTEGTSDSVIYTPDTERRSEVVQQGSSNAKRSSSRLMGRRVEVFKNNSKKNTTAPHNFSVSFNSKLTDKVDSGRQDVIQETERLEVSVIGKDGIETTLIM